MEFNDEIRRNATHGFTTARKKISSSERVIEPENQEYIEEDDFKDLSKAVEAPANKQKLKQMQDAIATNVEETRKYMENQIEFRKPVEQKVQNQETQEAYINTEELKQIAISLLPSIDKLMIANNSLMQIDKDKKQIVYESLCDEAINLAFAFENVWDKKIEIVG